MLMKISEIKPDPGQPRRTFNEEKMEALRASIRADGFRTQYPIIINGGNHIVDGERRWRAAKAVGIKQVPVEIKHDVNDFQRLMYQLKSEGAELEIKDRYDAWFNAYKKGKPYGHTFETISDELGINFSTYKDAVENVTGYYEISKELKAGKRVTRFSEHFTSIAELTNIKDPKTRIKLAEKAVDEKWNQEKSRKIKKAIKENPLREKQILSMDYSDPYEGSNQWKLRLEVAKSDIDVQALEDMKVNREKMFHQVDKWDQLMRSIVGMRVAMKEFDFKLAPPEIRVKLHQTIKEVAPFLTTYIKDLEKFMLENGELEVTNKLEA